MGPQPIYEEKAVLSGSRPWFAWLVPSDSLPCYRAGKETSTDLSIFSEQGARTCAGLGCRPPSAANGALAGRSASRRLVGLAEATSRWVAVACVCV